MATATENEVDNLLEELFSKKEAAPEAETDEEIDLDDVEQRKPPADGPCRRCGEEKPINRLMLCYPCWVKSNLEDEAKARGGEWREGMPHPAWCQCEGLSGHQRRSAGN